MKDVYTSTIYFVIKLQHTKKSVLAFYTANALTPNSLEKLVSFF